MDNTNTIHSLFEKQAQENPLHIAVESGKNSLTYDELNKKANQLAHYLLARNIPQDTPIAFCMERSIDCLIIMFAILKAGAAYLPLDPSNPEERLLLILNNSYTPFLITSSDFHGQFIRYQGTLILFDHAAQEIDKQPTNNLNLSISCSQLAYVIYTSGSTGIPKGVLIEHQSIVNFVHWFADFAHLQAKQRIDFSANHTFDLAVSSSIAPVVLGLNVVIGDNETKQNINYYLNYLKNSKINIIKATPSYFKALLRAAKNKFIPLPDLKTIILGGETLSVAECKDWLALYPEHVLYNEYGPTETTVAVTQYTINNANISSLTSHIPIGKIGYNMHFLILDANNNPLPPYEVGELHLGGICLARGYLNQPKLTKKHFIPHPFSKEKNARLYKTGDLCRLRDDGVLEYFGRIDNQVKIRGFRIEPEEIKLHLLAYPAIEDAVVITQKDSLNENCLIAYYILKNNTTTPLSSDLRYYLRNLIPDFMIPSAFINVSSFPLTNNGKLNKALLPVPQYITNPSYEAPVTDVEKTLVGIWSEELGITIIGVKDDFYELGGHSLSAARTISKINHVLNTNLTMNDFYKAPNILQLSHIIARSKRKSPMALKSEPVHQKVVIPLSTFQFMLWISNTFESKAKKLNIISRKRFEGTLDKSVLEYAFHCVFKTQEILCYQIFKLRPAQLTQKKWSFKIPAIDLQSMSEEESELILQKSMEHLANYHPWPQELPLILAKLFYLKNNKTELQISMPHIICDDCCPDILLSNVSRFYLAYSKQANIRLLSKLPLTSQGRPKQWLKKRSVHEVHEHFEDIVSVEIDRQWQFGKKSIELLIANKQYKEYIFREQEYLKEYLDRDIHFWDNYLKDAGLFSISNEYIVKNMKGEQLPYSTYTKIEESILNKFRQFCAHHCITLNEGLCGAITLALHHCPGINLLTPYLYLNIIKSTRINEDYDNTIGCFLRLEPAKILLKKNSTIETITQQIRQSIIETIVYQQCPDLVKLSAIGSVRLQKTLIKKLMSTLTSIYATLCFFPKINRKILKLCSERLSLFKRANNFLININIQTSFISKPKKNQLNLFDLNIADVNSYQGDLLEIDNVLDVCFMRDDPYNAPYLVISANLKPEFRELIAQQTINIMATALHSQEHKGHEYELPVHN